MRRNVLRRRLGALATSCAVGAAVVLGSAGAASALSVNPFGDIIGVWTKNGVELNVKLGNINTLANGDMFTYTLPTAFSGTTNGARFRILTVPDPDRLSADQNFVSPNWLASFVGALPVLNGTQIQNAADSLAPYGGGVGGWINTLNSLSAVNGVDVIANSATSATLNTGTVSQSYQQTLFVPGGADNINNSTGSVEFGLSIGAAGAAPAGSRLVLCETYYGTGTAPPTFNGCREPNVATSFATQDFGTNQVKLTWSLVPEPGTLLLLSAGLAGLAASGRRRVAC